MLFFFLLFHAVLYVGMQGWIAWGWMHIRSAPSAKELPPLSVIIAAHNEEGKIRTTLETILQQSYPVFEVWVVLDRCSDHTLDEVQALQRSYSHLFYIEITDIPQGWTGKKYALNKGIAHARYDYFAFTDADCKVERAWLESIGHQFAFGAEIVLGLGLMKRESGLLNLFIRYETFYTAFQYIGMANNGFPYMGVGRNIAYTRKKYQDTDGFSSIQAGLSGDDDLLVNRHAQKITTQTMTRPQSRTYSEAKRNIKEWYIQKRRHISASHQYSRQSKIGLGLFHFSSMFFYLGMFFQVIVGEPQSMAPTFFIFLAKIITGWAIFTYINRLYIFERGLLLFYPLLDLQ